MNNGNHSLGLPYGLTLGPYGSLLILTWDRDNTGKSYLVVLDPSATASGSGSSSTTHFSRIWELPGVKSPHTLALVAKEGEVSVLVGETRQVDDSRLMRFEWDDGGATRPSKQPQSSSGIMAHWGGHEGHGQAHHVDHQEQQHGQSLRRQR